MNKSLLDFSNKTAFKVPYIIFHCSNCGVTLKKDSDVCKHCNSAILDRG